MYIIDDAEIFRGTTPQGTQSVSFVHVWCFLHASQTLGNAIALSKLGIHQREQAQNLKYCSIALL